MKFGAPVEDTKPDDFIDGDTFFRMGISPNMVEILPRISAVDFDQAWEQRIETVIDESMNLKVFVISAADLIANKKALGQLQDLADVEAIHKATESKQKK